MRGKKRVIIPLLISWLVAGNLGFSPALRASTQLAQVVYLTTSKACGCTMKLCRTGDELVSQVFTGPRQSLLERIDYATNKDQAMTYIQEYHLYTMPALLFLDERHNLLWCAVGEMRREEILAKLKQFGS